MALGYELTGTGPRLIANAGNAMAESIRQTGEKIRGDIIQHNTDRQVVGLLNDAKTLDVASPTFQNDLLGVLGKYPMALGDQRSQIGLSLLSKAWQQQQELQQASTAFGRQKELVNLRYGAGRNGLAADLPPLDVSQTPEMPQGNAGFGFNAGNRNGVMGRFGAGAGDGTGFGAGMRDQGGEGFGTPERELPNDLPPIPEPGAAQGNPLFDTDRVLRGIPGLDRTTYAKTMARTAEKVAARDISGGKPMFRSGTSDIVMVKPDGSSEVVYKADSRAKSIFVTESGEPYQQLSDGKWKYPDGSVKDEAPEVGIKRVPGFTEERRATETERRNEASEGARAEAAAVKEANRERDRVIQNQRQKRDELQRDRAAYKREFANKDTSAARKAELQSAVDGLTKNIDLLNERIDALSTGEQDPAAAPSGPASTQPRMRWNGTQLVPVN